MSRFKLLILSFILIPFLQIPAHGFEADDVTKLENGDIIFRTIHDQSTPGVEAIFLLHTSRDKLWQTITDYDNYAKHFDNVERIKVVNETKEGAVVEFWLKSIFRTFHYTVYRKYENPFHKLEWNQISGDFQTNKGSWEITDSQEGNMCLVRYRTFVELNGFWGKNLNKYFVPEARKRIQVMVSRLRKSLEISPGS